MLQIIKYFCIALIIGFLSYSINADAKNLPLKQIKLPEGFTISVFAQNVPYAREMALGDNGTVFVGTREGKVYALVPNKENTRAAKTITLLQGLNHPNGVAFRNGSLYVAEIHRVIRLDNIEKQLSNPPVPIVINDTFPHAKWHGLRVIHFGPDGKLYMGIGVPCNTCLLRDKRFGTIMRMNPDGTNLEVYAKGIRNTVGFDWQPKTNILWFTDNGQDWLGDYVPPDEVNRAPRKGMDFGFPYFYGNNVPAPKFGHLKSPKGMTIPAWNLPAHVAPLGLKFYTGTMFPEPYRDQIFVAEHGSWNRDKKIGYRVSLITLNNGKPTNYSIFAKGWLQGQNVWGRPVALLVLKDGSLLVSDDHAGVIYRIRYRL